MDGATKLADTEAHTPSWLPGLWGALFCRDCALRRESGVDLDVAAGGEGRRPAIRALQDLPSLEVDVVEGTTIAAPENNCPLVLLQYSSPQASGNKAHASSMLAYSS
jgi:hypothetical protein